jgi:hypothetical protein
MQLPDHRGASVRSQAIVNSESTILIGSIVYASAHGVTHCETMHSNTLLALFISIATTMPLDRSLLSQRFNVERRSCAVVVRAKTLSSLLRTTFEPALRREKVWP